MQFYRTVTLFAFTLLAAGCMEDVTEEQDGDVAEIQAGQPAGGDALEELSVGDSVSGSAEGERSTGEAEASGVQELGSCPGLYPRCSTCGSNACGQPCCAYESEPGFEIWYEDDCTTWAQPVWQRKNEPGLICHVDLDQHWNKVTIEIHVAEAYEDVGCAHLQDHWVKYEKDETSCSFFSGSSECEGRVQEEVMNVAAQGYIPAFSQPDVDECPHPRL